MDNILCKNGENKNVKSYNTDEIPTDNLKYKSWSTSYSGEMY